MLINRSKLWMVLGLPLLLTSIASGQELPDYEWVPGIRDFQPFGPASDRTSPYGSGPKRNKGWFFTIEDLDWSTSAPDRVPIGAPLNTPGVNQVVSTGVPGGFMNQVNTMDTGFIQPAMRQGERLQLGYVGDDGVGFLVGTFVLHGAQNVGNATNAGVAFSAPFVNGISPLEGFLEESLPVPTNQPGFGGSTGGTGTGKVAIVDADLNNNGVFGASGRDIGTPNPTPPPTFIPPRDGFPDVPAPTDFGDLVGLPIYFDHIYTSYSTNVWGIEVMRTYWLTKNRRTDYGNWDIMGGVRYIRFRDNFYFQGTGSQAQLSDLSGGTGGGGTSSGGGGTVISGLLSDTNFSTTTANYLVGPQIGLRWSKQRGRLAWSCEARGLAAANFQTTVQRGSIAQRPDNGTLQPSFFVFNPQPTTNFLNGVNGGGGTGGSSTNTTPFTLPQFRVPALTPTGVYNVVHRNTFAPVGELRFNASYQIFRNIQATVGWTGLFMGGIGRSTQMTNYALPTLGISNTGSREFVLVQGLNFGFTVNR